MLLLWGSGLFFFGTLVYPRFFGTLVLFFFGTLILFGMGECRTFLMDVPDRAEKMSKFLFVDIFLNISI